MSDKNKTDNSKQDKKKSLFMQIIKFGVVGGISCVIDFAIYSVLIYAFNVSIAWAAFWGFTISLIFNYVASMAFVFERKDDANKVAEFVTFAILSMIGLGLNEVIILGVVKINEVFVIGQTSLFASMITGINGFVDFIVGGALGLIGKEYTPVDWIPIEAKVLATAIVMVYNFITRKIFIEKKD